MRPHVTAAAAVLLVFSTLATREIAAQSLAGMVLDVHTRAPMAKIRVRLATDSGDVVAIDTSRTNGVFYLTAAASGKYLVVFETAAGVALLAPQPVTLQADSATQVRYLLDFSTVADPAGADTPSASLRAGHERWPACPTDRAKWIGHPGGTNDCSSPLIESVFAERQAVQFSG